MIVAQLVYADVPAEVSSITAYAWREGSRPVALSTAVNRDGATLTVTFHVDGMAVVQLERADGSYLLDGPLVARATPEVRALDQVWRHTIGGATASGVDATPPLVWVAGQEEGGGAWPSCWWTAVSHWECAGVALGARGIVVGAAGTEVLSAPITMTAAPVLQRSTWGRVISVADRGVGAPPRLRLTVARPVSPAQRTRAMRLETAAVADVRVTGVAPGIFWAAGDSSPPGAWMEIRSARSGPVYVPLIEVAYGPPTLPMRVALEDSRTVTVTVHAAAGEPASGTLVTAFRIIDPEPAVARQGQPPPRRVLAGETTASLDGVAALGGLGEADYEIVAWHPRLGRATLRLRPDASDVTIALQPPGIVRGRVLMNGKPAAGVNVASVPDPQAYAAAVDPIDVKGGDGQSGEDGRFALPTAAGGGGELRVGGGAYAVVRIPLPRMPLPLVDVGDIELARGIDVAVVLDQDPGCDLRAAGPIGRSGLQIVRATQTGPGLYAITLPEGGVWEFTLMCGRNERAVTPAVVTIDGGRGAQEIRLTVR